MPLATVAATVMEMKAPTKFSTAATPTATFGFSAPVAIVVAIAFAVSWNPLVKSKTSATATTSTTMMSPALIPAERTRAAAVQWGRSQVGHGHPAHPGFDAGTMDDDVIQETRERLAARLEELRPYVEE